MRNTIGIIGHFGSNLDFCDGQTVKTKNLAEQLEHNGYSIYKVDTYFKSSKLTLLLRTLKCLLTCRHIFLLVSTNGMKFYLPFLHYINKVTKRRIYHYVVGSELLKLVAQDDRYVRFLNSLNVNWFEYESGTELLKQLGVRNAVTLPNFKALNPVPGAQPYTATDGCFRFCTFSRIMEEKGISDAIETVCAINTHHGYQAELDIYGPIDPDYDATFQGLLREHQDFVSYKGVADSKKSVEVLKDYYALLFPTHWAGEGVPGTLIDAFAAGIPVIASDWNANRELVRHKKQGLLYPNEEMTSLTDAALWAVHHPEAMNLMRVHSREEYDRYTPETVMKEIFVRMDER